MYRKYQLMNCQWINTLLLVWLYWASFFMYSTVYILQQSALWCNTNTFDIFHLLQFHHIVAHSSLKRVYTLLLICTEMSIVWRLRQQANISLTFTVVWQAFPSKFKDSKVQQNKFISINTELCSCSCLQRSKFTSDQAMCVSVLVWTYGSLHENILKLMWGGLQYRVVHLTKTFHAPCGRAVSESQLVFKIPGGL